MNAISNFTIYFIVLCVVAVALMLYIALFQLILQFKWNIDYFQLRDKSCTKNNWTKFEIESYRYNLFAFFYDIYRYSYLDAKSHDIIDKYVAYSYKSIRDTYTSVYNAFMWYVIIFMVALIVLLIFKGTVFAWVLYVLVIFVFVIYFVVNAFVVKNFDKINERLSNTNNPLFRYNAVYKILNAIILISKLQDIPVEYSYYKLNEEKKTFEEILENNIASCENISNTSKIKQVKLNVYDNLDFLKYMVLDKTSPHYWKYFENPYIRLPAQQTKQYDISENLFLSELFLKRNAHLDYDSIKLEFNDILELIKGNTNDIYKSLYDRIYGDYPVAKNYEKVRGFYEDINNRFSSNKLLESYNKVLYDKVKEGLQNIEILLKNQQYNGIYETINDLIHKKLTAKIYTSIQIPNNDYIQYFLDNKDILFNSEYDTNTDFQEIFDMVEEFSRYIYAYFVFFILIFFMISHYLYITINGPRYIYIMVCIVMLYLFYGYMMTLMQATAE